MSDDAILDLLVGAAFLLVVMMCLALAFVVAKMPGVGRTEGAKA